MPKSIAPKSITKKTEKIKLTEDLKTKVEFTRGTCFKDGVCSWPWSWSIIVQNGHLYDSCKSYFNTIEEAIEDFLKNGKNKFHEAQKELKKISID